MSKLCVATGSDGGGTDAGSDVISNDVVSNDVSVKDVSQDVEAGPSWDPAQLSNLALWFDDTVGITAVGNRVAAWADRSSNKNDVSEDVDATPGPTLTKSALNGHDVVTYAAGVPLSRTNVTGLQLHADFGIEMVARVNAGGPLLTHGTIANQLSFTGWLVTFSPTRAGFIYELNGNASGTSFLSPVASYSDNKFHIIEVRRTGGQLTVAVDGTSSAAASFTTDLANSGPLGLGGDAANGLYSGDVAEEIVVDGTVSDPDEAKIVAYFKSKFAL